MNTVKMYEIIQETGLSKEKSEALVEEIEKLVNERFNDRKEHLATKQDVGEVKVEIASMEARLIKWTIGTGLGAAGLVVALLKLL